MASDKKIDFDWLREQCSLLMYGQCTTRSCLIRGGYSGRGSVDTSIATCEAKELFDYVIRLEKDNDGS